MAYINIPGAGSAQWKDPVTTSASLPTQGNQPGDVRITLDDQSIHVWDGVSSWVAINSSVAITDTYVVASQAAMLALSANRGDIAIRTDISKSFILQGNDPTVLGDWQELLSPPNTVTSVNGATGVVVLSTSDISEGTNLYYTSVRANSDFDTRLATKSTTNLSEGTNLYYTSARANSDFDTRLATKSTTNLTEGTNLYYTSARANSDFDTRLATKSTSDLTEGTNLYYTASRFNSAFSAKSTSDLSEGTNLYYTSGRFDTAFSAKSTSDLAEGTNLYFTNSRAIAAPLTGYISGAGVVAASDSVLQAIQKLNGNITALGTPLTGSGTSGTIPKYSGTNTLTDSNIALDASGNPIVTCATPANGASGFRVNMTAPATAGAYYGKRLGLTATVSSNAINLVGDYVVVSGGALSNASSTIYGYRIDIQSDCNGTLDTWAGTGSIAAFFTSRGGNSGSNQGNVGVLATADGGNLNYGQQIQVTGPAGSSPKMYGSTVGLNPTGASVAIGYYAGFGTTSNQALMSPRPTNSGLFAGNNGTTALDLVNLQSNGTTVFQVVDSGQIKSASLTASRALVSDASSNIVHSATTATEIGYVSGVTSAIQTQLNAKASSTPPAARAHSSSTTITGSIATIVFDTEDYDTASAFNISTGEFTAPSAGKYQVNAAIRIAATLVLNNVIELAIYKNGSEYAHSIQYAGGAQTSLTGFVGDIVDCAANDVITIRALCSGTSPSISGTNSNYVSIVKVSS